MISSPILGQFFFFFFNKRAFLAKMGVDVRRFILDKVPTIYHVNLRDPSGLLLAAAFQMRTKDVMYVANAKVVDYYKLLTLINNTTATGSNTANMVTNVNAARISVRGAN